MGPHRSDPMTFGAPPLRGRTGDRLRRDRRSHGRRNSVLAVGSYDFRRLLQWLSFMLRLFLAALRSAPDDQNCLPVPKGGPTTSDGSRLCRFLIVEFERQASAIVCQFAEFALDCPALALMTVHKSDSNVFLKFACAKGP